MPKPRNTHTEETSSKPAGKPKAKMGKKAPLTDTLDWKKPFEAWASGRSNSLFTPIREVLGKLNEEQIGELNSFLHKLASENCWGICDADDFDPSAPPVQLTYQQFCAIRNATFSEEIGSSTFGSALLAVSQPPALVGEEVIFEIDGGSGQINRAGGIAMGYREVPDPLGHIINELPTHFYPKAIHPSILKFDTLMAAANFDDNHHAIRFLFGLSKNDSELSTRLVTALIALLEKEAADSSCAHKTVISAEALDCIIELKATGAIPVLKKTCLVLYDRYGADGPGGYLDVLKALGHQGGMEAILAERAALGLPPRQDEEPAGIDSLKKDQQAAYSLLSNSRDLKQAVLEGSKVLEILPEPQAWITVNDPEITKEAVRILIGRLGPKIQKLDSLLFNSICARTKQLEDTHFRFYADEIIDAVFQLSGMKELAHCTEFTSVLAKAKYSNGTKLRFARREKSDLSLGDKCGDCTAKGSINFANSITWYVNPAYNVLKMSQGRHFIGKINFTLGKIAGEEAVIIDALEFNPQAKEGKPLHDEALECFETAINFLRELAARQNRALFALTFSNSGGASNLLRSKGDLPVFVEGEGVRFISPEEAEKISDKIRTTGNEPVAIKLFVPSDDVSRVLATGGFTGKPRLFYQMVDAVTAVGAQAPAMDEKLPILESEVFNPAQIENAHIAKAMSGRDFESASKLILEDEKWLARVKEIFNMRPNMRVSPAFLVSRMQRIYAADAWEMETLNRAFMVDIDKFVKL